MGQIVNMPLINCDLLSVNHDSCNVTLVIQEGTKMKWGATKRGKRVPKYNLVLMSIFQYSIL